MRSNSTSLQRAGALRVWARSCLTRRTPETTPGQRSKQFPRPSSGAHHGKRATALPHAFCCCALRASSCCASDQLGGQLQVQPRPA